MISFLYCDKLSTCEISLLKHLNLFWFFFSFAFLFSFGFDCGCMCVCFYLVCLLNFFVCLFCFFFSLNKGEKLERGLTSKVLRFDC